jgi:excisionase family DNA binding protein
MTALLLRPEEVWRELGISRTVAYAMIARGELPVVRIGRSVRVPREALERWVREHTDGSAARHDMGLRAGAS